MSNMPIQAGPLRAHGLISVNFHINRTCDARCTFCFAQFDEVDGQLSLEGALAVIDRLREAGAEKITFVGGEPTLHPHLGVMLRHAHGLGFTTCVVSNGSRVAALLDTHADVLHWLGLSVDSAVEAVETRLGRGRGQHVARAIALADRARSLGIRLKLNTVVNSLNWEEDMSALVRRMRPDRWKVFQVLPVLGQNDGAVEPLLVSDEQFGAFCDRHSHLSAEGLAPVVEDNDAMRGSYVMVDPLGRLFSNATGEHRYSEPLLEVGIEQALGQVLVSAERFVERGGLYPWR